jgi:hypothetical protein
MIDYIVFFNKFVIFLQIIYSLILSKINNIEIKVKLILKKC